MPTIYNYLKNLNKLQNKYRNGLEIVDKFNPTINAVSSINNSFSNYMVKPYLKTLKDFKCNYSDLVASSKINISTIQEFNESLASLKSSVYDLNAFRHINDYKAMFDTFKNLEPFIASIRDVAVPFCYIRTINQEIENLLPPDKNLPSDKIFLRSKTTRKLQFRKGMKVKAQNKIIINVNFSDYTTLILNLYNMAIATSLLEFKNQIYSIIFLILALIIYPVTKHIEKSLKENELDN